MLVTTIVGVGEGVGVGGGYCPQYLPPVFNTGCEAPCPPQTITSLPVHTAVCPARAVGPLVVVVVAVQLFVAGVYRPPALEMVITSNPPQTII